MIIAGNLQAVILKKTSLLVESRKIGSVWLFGQILAGQTGRVINYSELSNTLWRVCCHRQKLPLVSGKNFYNGSGFPLF